MKTLEQYFVDWESSAMGYGYGTGEPHTIPALRQFLSCCTKGSYNHSYDYTDIETACGPVAAWLLINILCKADIIEYGSSPRFAWLTDKGVKLRDFVLAKSANDLVDLIGNRTEDDTICYPNACNCGPVGYDEKAICANPFWRSDFELAKLAGSGGNHPLMERHWFRFP